MIHRPLGCVVDYPSQLGVEIFIPNGAKSSTQSWRARLLHRVYCSNRQLINQSVLPVTNPRTRHVGSSRLTVPREIVFLRHEHYIPTAYLVYDAVFGVLCASLENGSPSKGSTLTDEEEHQSFASFR